MSLNRIEEGLGKKLYKCELCGVTKKNSVYYKLKPHPAIIKLLNNFDIRIVCHLCAMREEFGTNYRQNKRYILWIK